MEASVKESRKRKFAIPALLLIGALMCISWLGMENAEPNVAQHEMTSAADTIPDQKGIASYSRKSIITIDENGQPHEEIIEEFNGDESLRPLIQERFQILPDTSVQAFPSLPSDAGISRWMDTIPPLGFRGDKEWREFAEAMQENFRKHFESFQHLQDDSLFMQRFADRWKSFEIPGEAFRALEKFEQDEAFKHMEEELQRFHDLDLERFRRMGEDFARPFRNRTEGYEDALRKRLLEDGYLKENESIESLEWTNESFKVNGKSIDRDDRKKYQELNNRFFGNQP